MGANIFLIHWHAEEAAEKAEKLEEAGYRTIVESEDGERGGKKVKSTLPDAVVIYLSRMPSDGLVTAEWLKKTKATSRIPIIFVDGKRDKVRQVKDNLPDAVFTTSKQLMKKLQQIVTA